MSLRTVKEKFITIKLFKLSQYIAFIGILVIFSQSSTALGKENNKLKVKINYTDSPNWSDFFKSKNLESFLDINKREILEGSWSGNFNLEKDSIYWVNPKEDSDKIKHSIYRGPYSVTFHFTFNDKDVLKDFKILQDSVKYSSVKIELANEKQINYWAKAEIGNWLQIIRGKILTNKENKLFNIYQTIVYENKIPIYAFRGKSILNKEMSASTLTIN